MNRVLITIGSINIYWYSFLIVLSIIIGMIIANREARKTAIGKVFMTDLIFFLVIVGIIGARVYYVIFNYDAFRDDFLSIFKIWEGGLAIYGAVILCGLFIIYYCHKKEKPILLTLDILAPCLILGQAIGRWGNFFNQEAYGRVTTLSSLQKLHIPNFIIEGMYINGNYFEPTFLYESIWCFLGFIILLILKKIFKYSKKGIIIFSYFVWYGLGRFFIESLRSDSLYLGNYRISQIVSLALMVIGIIGVIFSLIKNNEKQVTNVTF